MAPSSPSYAAISIGGKAAVIVFVFSLFGFVIESELAQVIFPHLYPRHKLMMHIVCSRITWISPAVLYIVSA